MAPTYEQFVEALNQWVDQFPYRLDSDEAMALGVMRKLGTSGPYARKLFSEAVAKGDVVPVAVSETGIVHLGSSNSFVLYLHLSHRWRGESEYGGVVADKFPESRGALWSGGTRKLYTSKAGYGRLVKLHLQLVDQRRQDQSRSRVVENAKLGLFLDRTDPRATEALRHLREMGVDASLRYRGTGRVHLNLGTQTEEETRALLGFLIQALPAAE